MWVTCALPQVAIGVASSVACATAKRGASTIELPIATIVVSRAIENIDFVPPSPQETTASSFGSLTFGRHLAGEPNQGRPAAGPGQFTAGGVEDLDRRDRKPV